MKILPIVDVSRRCVKLSVLALLCALAACGSTEDDSLATSVIASNNSNAPVQPAKLSEGGELEGAIHSQSPAPDPLVPSAAASVLIGTVIEIAPSRSGLTLEQFSFEVHSNMAARERQTGLPLQWFGTFQMKEASPRAFVTIVAVGAGREAAGDSRTRPALSNTASIANVGDTAAGDKSSIDPAIVALYSPQTNGDTAARIESSIDPYEARYAVCLGGTPAISRQELYNLQDAYENATEAMAVGLPVGTPLEMVRERLDELNREEATMSRDESENRLNARIAFRDKRYDELMQCRGIS